MSAPNVTVTPTSPLTITGSTTAYGTITIMPGGQIFVKTSAKISVDALVKSTGAPTSVETTA